MFRRYIYVRARRALVSISPPVELATIFSVRSTRSSDTPTTDCMKAQQHLDEPSLRCATSLFRHTQVAFDPPVSDALPTATAVPIFQGDVVVRYSDVVPPEATNYFASRFGEREERMIYTTPARVALAQQIQSLTRTGFRVLEGQTMMGKSHVLLRITKELRDQGHAVIFFPDAMCLSHFERTVPVIEFGIARWYSQHRPTDQPPILTPDSFGRQLVAFRKVVQEVNTKLFIIVDQVNHLHKDDAGVKQQSADMLSYFYSTGICILCSSITALAKRKYGGAIDFDEFVDFMPDRIIAKLLPVEFGTQERMHHVCQITNRVPGEVSRFARCAEQTRDVRKPDDTWFNDSFDEYVRQATQHFESKFLGMDPEVKRQLAEAFVLRDRGVLNRWGAVVDRRFFPRGRPMTPVVANLMRRLVNSVGAGLWVIQPNQHQLGGMFEAMCQYISTNMERDLIAMEDATIKSLSVETRRDVPSSAEFAAAYRRAIAGGYSIITFWPPPYTPHIDAIRYELPGVGGSKPTRATLTLINFCGTNHDDSYLNCGNLIKRAQAVCDVPDQQTRWVWLSWSSYRSLNLGGEEIIFDKVSCNVHKFEGNRHWDSPTATEYLFFLPYDALAALCKLLSQTAAAALTATSEPTRTVRCFEMTGKTVNATTDVIVVEVLPCKLEGATKGKFFVWGLRKAIRQELWPHYNDVHVNRITIYKMTNEKKRECATTLETGDNEVQPGTVYCFTKDTSRG